MTALQQFLAFHVGSLSGVDIVLLLVVGSFVLSGFWFGLIHMVGSLASFALGIYAAGTYYVQLATWASHAVGGSENFWKIAAPFILFVLVGRLVGLVFSVINKIFHAVAIIPFLKTFNRLLGAALGFVEGVIGVSLAVYFASRFPLTQGFADVLRHSQVVAWFNVIGEWLAPLLPMAVRVIRSVL